MTPSEQKDAILRSFAGERAIRRRTLTTVAAEIGKDDRTVGRWERGLDNPGLGALIAWATSLGFEIHAVRKEEKTAPAADLKSSKQGASALNAVGVSA